MSWSGHVDAQPNISGVWCWREPDQSGGAGLQLEELGVLTPEVGRLLQRVKLCGDRLEDVRVEEEIRRSARHGHGKQRTMVPSSYYKPTGWLRYVRSTCCGFSRYTDWCVAYHGTMICKSAPILLLGIWNPGEVGVTVAHGQAYVRRYVASCT
jgi:hypothetical protein